MTRTPSNLTDHELYLKAKKVITREFTTGNPPGLLSDRIYLECKRRNIAIWNKAMQDSMTISSSINTVFETYPDIDEGVITINRIDFTTIYELNTIMGISLKTIESIITLSDGYSFGKVIGDSMKDEDILAGDVVIVEEVVDIDDNAVVLVSLQGRKIIKRLRYTHDGILLESANPKHKSMLVPHGEADILGVVRFNIRAVK